MFDERAQSGTEHVVSDPTLRVLETAASHDQESIASQETNDAHYGDASACSGWSIDVRSLGLGSTERRGRAPIDQTARART